MALIFQQVGYPNPEEESELRPLAGWSEHFPKAAPTVWPLQATRQLGTYGVALLREFLHIGAKRRPSAMQARQHAYFYPPTVSLPPEPVWPRSPGTPPSLPGAAPVDATRSLSGNSLLGSEFGVQSARAVGRTGSPVSPPERQAFSGGVVRQGAKGPFVITETELDRDLLQWLQMDVYFADMNMEFLGSVGGAETSVKEEYFFHTGPNRIRSLTVNGQDASRPVFERLACWVTAFKHINRNALNALGEQLSEELLSLTDDQLGINGRYLRDVNPSIWLFKFATIQIMKCGERADPRHFDGGAALLMCSITLFGERELQVESATHTVQMDLRPGSVYLASLAAAAHQVLHLPRRDGEELLEVNSGADACRVVILLRGSTFRAARGSVVPGPTLAFQAAQRAVSAWQASAQLWLPSLVDCQQFCGVSG